VKDFNGDEVNVGDYIVFIEPYYRNLKHGKAIKINPKSVTVEYEMKKYGKYHNCKTVRFADQFVLS
jgi:hypothetical protein